MFTAAYDARLPVLLKGPTGCGKTRFVEYMAATLPRSTPDGDGLGHLVTVACHEDLTGSDLVGRYLIKGDETVWIDGPLTRAVRHGAICYLDEIVEARKDTIVLIHPLTDHRRLLPIDKTGELLEAHPDFLLVISYNPGYQSILKDLKHSTRQRFVALEFGYPPLDDEARIIAHESRRRPRHGAAPRHPGREGSSSAAERPVGGRQHASPRLRRPADRPRRRATTRLRGGREPRAHRRPRGRARDR